MVGPSVDSTSQVPGIVKTVITKKVRYHGAAHPVMANNDQRMLARQRSQFVGNLLHGNHDAVADEADSQFLRFSNIEHCARGSVRPHFREFVNADVIICLLHLVYLTYSLAPFVDAARRLNIAGPLRYAIQQVSFTPADVYFGRGQSILKQRERIKLKTMENRRLQYCKYAA
jgi:hypothetical protein